MWKCRPDDPRYSAELQTEISKLVAGISMQTLCVLAKGSACPKDKCNTESMRRFADVPDCKVFQQTWTGWLEKIHLTEPQVRVESHIFFESHIFYINHTVFRARVRALIGVEVMS